MPLLLGTNSPVSQADAMDTSQRILNVIGRYKAPIPKGSADHSDEGDLKFLSRIYRAVKTSEPVRMVLPAFSFKSPNSSTKVLGALPDKAEDVALAHLSGLCAAVKDVYSPGAVLTIVPDGLMYNDLVNVSDHTVWAYGRALQHVAKIKGYTSIQFAPLQHLLGMTLLQDDSNGMEFAATASSVRLTLLHRYGAFVREPLPEDENTRLMYAAHLESLALDLATTYPIGPERSKVAFNSGIEIIAKCMLKRSAVLAKAIHENYADHVLLSTLPSTGRDHISVSTLPVPTLDTPWNTTLAFMIDGKVVAGHRTQFDEDATLELVHEADTPSYFRERSPLYHWTSDIHVKFEPIYPCGMIIRPCSTASIHDIDASKVRHLAEHNSPVILRGFTHTKDRDAFISKAHELGVPTAWKFGILLEVKDRGSEGREFNNTLTQEAMPFHYDGMFKLKMQTRTEDGSEHLVPNPPRFQFFTAVTPSPPNTGFTLFSGSRLLLNHLPHDIPISHLASLTWSITTSSFDNTTLRNMPLIQPHPTTAQPCLRYHERWPQSKTQFEPVEVTLENAPDQVVCEVLEQLLYDRRVCYWHTWDEGDLLVNDNTAFLHTRSAFEAGVDRELWRIHFD